MQTLFLKKVRASGLCLYVTFGVLAIQFMPQISAQEYRIVHCFLGCPEGANPDNHLILRSIYALSYNTQTKVADWAAYQLSSSSIGIASSLSREPIIDNFVADTLQPSDFDSADGIGLTRAQLVPLVNFAGTPYWNEVNYLSNTVARSRSLSRGAWYGLEWAIRNLVNREGSVYVLTGPVFSDPPQTPQLRTATPHRVPDAFFKIVVSEGGSATAFMFAQNVPVHRHHCELRTTIAEVEQATGLRFFPEARVLDFTALDSKLGCSM